MPALETEIDVVTADDLESFSLTAIKKAAHQLAERHLEVGLLNIDHQSLDRLNAQKAILYQAYTTYHQLAEDDQLFGQGGEWLLDNYYVINNAISQIEQDMPGEYYRQLPRCITGEWVGLPRIYLIAQELLNNQQTRLEMDWVKQFISY